MDGNKMTIKFNGAYIDKLYQEHQLGLQLMQIPNSQTTDYILFNFTVPDTNSGDIVYGVGGPTIATNGKTTVAFDALLMSFIKIGVLCGNCQRVWLSFGGASSKEIQNTTFTNIQSILSFENSTNEKNEAIFEIFKSNIKSIYEKFNDISGVSMVGFDIDYEEDFNTLTEIATNFVVNVYKWLGCCFTFCAYDFGTAGDWAQALMNIKKILGVQPVKAINLQMYDGGAGNDINEWIKQLKATAKSSGNIADSLGISDLSRFIWPIQIVLGNQNPADIQADFSQWAVPGGSLWSTRSLTDKHQTYTMAEYAAAIANGCARNTG
jgi:hypothetical protein